jgi:aminopeptidase
MENRIAKAFARLAIDTCLAIGEGDRLRIAAEITQRGLVHAFAARAWERGARAVRVDWTDSRLSRIFYDKARDFLFDEVPSYVGRDGQDFVDEGWCTLSLHGEEDPAALDGVDPAKLQRQQRVRAEALSSFRHAIHSNLMPWTVVPVPTAAWAAAVFAAAGKDPGPDPEARLWEVLVPILHLDLVDPAAALEGHLELLMARAKALDAARISELRWLGPGTDLRIGLSPRSRWAGGSSCTPGGRRFVPNHPTEEVFTSPDNRLAEGRVACTRPVKVLGETVDGAWFEFRDGKVIASGAKKGEATLLRYLDIDPGSQRLGEAALVDSTGPIWKSGLVFDNGLIDENAACHIALGSSYGDAFEGTESMDTEARRGVGFNDSLVHVDFMIGSDEVEVRATLADGSSMDLIREGKFVL